MHNSAPLFPSTSRFINMCVSCAHLISPHNKRKFKFKTQLCKTQSFISTLTNIYIYIYIYLQLWNIVDLGISLSCNDNTIYIYIFIYKHITTKQLYDTFVYCLWSWSRCLFSRGGSHVTEMCTWRLKHSPCLLIFNFVLMLHFMYM